MQSQRSNTKAFLALSIDCIRLNSMVAWSENWWNSSFESAPAQVGSAKYCSDIRSSMSICGRKLMAPVDHKAHLRNELPLLRIERPTSYVNSALHWEYTRRIRTIIGKGK